MRNQRLADAVPDYLTRNGWLVCLDESENACNANTLLPVETHLAQCRAVEWQRCELLVCFWGCGVRSHSVRTPPNM